MNESIKTVLIVDDDENLLNVSQLIMEKQGYKVTTFKDGESAFETFSKDQSIHIHELLDA